MNVLLPVLIIKSVKTSIPETSRNRLEVLWHMGNVNDFATRKCYVSVKRIQQNVRSRVPSALRWGLGCANAVLKQHH